MKTQHPGISSPLTPHSRRPQCKLPAMSVILCNSTIAEIDECLMNLWHSILLKYCAEMWTWLTGVGRRRQIQLISRGGCQELYTTVTIFLHRSRRHSHARFLCSRPPFKVKYDHNVQWRFKETVFGGPGPSSFGRQQRLSEITIKPIKNLGSWARFGGLCPAALA